MPKMKSHSGSKKRFRVTANGRVKRAQQGKNHILNKKPRKRIMRLRQGAYLKSLKQEKTIRNMAQK